MRRTDGPQGSGMTSTLKSINSWKIYINRVGHTQNLCNIKNMQYQNCTISKICNIKDPFSVNYPQYNAGKAKRNTVPNRAQLWPANWCHFGISGTNTIGGIRHRGNQTKQHNWLSGSVLNSKLSMSSIILNEWGLYTTQHVDSSSIQAEIRFIRACSLWQSQYLQILLRRVCWRNERCCLYYWWGTHMLKYIRDTYEIGKREQ